MMRITRTMQDTDLSLVIGIESRAFSHPWPPKAFEDVLTMRPWVLVVDGILVGYIFYHTVIDEAVILNFAIDPDLQGMGHGEHLLSTTLELLQKEGLTNFYLDVRQSNASAIALYNKYGFIPLGIRRNYYSDPVEDAIVMGMKLPFPERETL